MPKKPEHRLQVKRSTAGLGLFTKDPIETDAFVIEYTGKRLKGDAAHNATGKYLFELDDDTIIDGKGRENKARYINHSCDPNCEVHIKRGRVFIYSIRDILPGEEITYDYGEEYFNEYIKPHGCRCTLCASNKRRKSA